MIMSKLAGSNACTCALAQMKLAGMLSCAARAVDADGAALRPEQPRDGERCGACAAADIEHPAWGSGANRFDEQFFERFEHSVEQLVHLDPGAPSETVPKPRLLISLVCHIHDGSFFTHLQGGNRQGLLQKSGTTTRSSTSEAYGLPFHPSFRRVAEISGPCGFEETPDLVAEILEVSWADTELEHVAQS